MKKYPPISELYPHMLHGGDYNPDQWLHMPEIIEEDMRLMKLAHVNTMSLGIFSWTQLEPQDGVYDFSYLDTMIEKIGKNGGKVLLATPTGGKPLWMSKKYPEIRMVDQSGDREPAGRRQNHCYNSPVYREKTYQINTRLAERYGNNDTVLGWHISNEYGNCRLVCYCDNCRAKFREFIKAKYKTLDNLNQSWCTQFWSHTVTEWDQIEPPSDIGENSVHGLSLDWKRFVSNSYTDYMKFEIDAIRKFSDKPVTANLMRNFTKIDYWEMAKHIDVASWDSYPYWHRDDAGIEHADVCFNNDFFRSLKGGKPFLLMESTPSMPNWHDINKLKRPGVNRLGGLQSVSQGSDSVQYFQWRMARGNVEKFHGAVVSHEGSENTRVFREVASLGETLEKLDAIVGCPVESDVAVFYSAENKWALDDAQGFNKNNKKLHETIVRHYKQLLDRGINTDIVGYESDFSKYKAVIAPMLYSVSDELIDKIERYVAEGGTFITTYISGMVDKNDLCYLGGFPAGKLKDVFGLWNEEIDSLYPHDGNKVEFGGKEYKAIDYCELVHARGARVLGSYKEDFYAGMSAVLENSYGKGKAYYVAFRDTGDFLTDFYEKIVTESGLKSSFDGTLAEGVISRSRTDGEFDYVFLFNYRNEERTVSTSAVYTDMETGETRTGDIKLCPFGSIVMKIKK